MLTLRMRKLAVLGALLLMAVAPSAHAVITLDAVIPNSPAVGETVFARMSDGICDAIIEADGYPQITQTGNSIRMLLETVHAEEPILCIYGEGTLDIPVGAFPGGSYSLQVDRRYVDFFGTDIVEAVGTTAFVVGGPAGGISLPMLGHGGLLVLVLGLLATAWLTLSRRVRAGFIVVLAFSLLPLGVEAQTESGTNLYVQVLLSADHGGVLPRFCGHFR